MAMKQPSRNFKSLLKISICLVFLKLIGFIFYCVVNEITFWHLKTSLYDISNVGDKEYPMVTSYERIDWHNYSFMEYESKRIGKGEQGQGYEFKNEEDIKESLKMHKQEGLSVMVSDQISPERSLQDTRPEACMTQKYLKSLPSTSVIVIFYNEWPSILKRAIHSIYNRSPHELLKEIIVVDDSSTNPELKEPLELYLKEKFDDRVKLVRLTGRKGLIVTRMEGAKVATGDVLIFLDSHIEVNVNWLPPLLEPIVISPKTVTLPIIDGLDGKTFAYHRSGGTRGIVNELFWYQWLSRRKRDSEIEEKPYQMPIMLGCAYAIRRDYYMDIGQNDEQLMIWNGEQIELSFKVHLCGGNMIVVPCSRICHTFRGINRNHVMNGTDFTSRNFKRVAEVWLDDYKEVFYEADPQKREIDVGDLTKMKMIKSKLKCKPFDYFLEEIAPDMFIRYFYQKHYPGYFASGLIRSFEYPDLCLDFSWRNDKKAGLNECRNVNDHVRNKQQFFLLTWHRKLRLRGSEVCLYENGEIEHCQYGDWSHVQEWKYNSVTKQLIFLKDEKCLSGHGESKSIDMAKCNENDPRQKWIFTNTNEKALKNFESIYFEDGRFYGMDLIS